MMSDTSVCPQRDGAFRAMASGPDNLEVVDPSVDVELNTFVERYAFSFEAAASLALPPVNGAGHEELAQECLRDGGPERVRGGSQEWTPLLSRRRWLADAVRLVSFAGGVIGALASDPFARAQDTDRSLDRSAAGNSRPAATASQPTTAAAVESSSGAQLTAAARQAVAAGLAYLAAQQNEDGSFGRGHYSRNPAICGLCGMAFLAQGSTPGRGPYGQRLDRLTRFLLDATQPSGFIEQAESASRGPMYDHGFATLFLSEVYGMSRAPALREKLAQAVKLIVATQNQEGGWRYQPRREDADISVTVCQVMALRAAHNAGLFVPVETLERALDYVRRCQNPDGGFSYFAGQPRDSAFPRSAAALVALHSGGVYEGPEVDRGLQYLLRFPPNAQNLGQAYYFYGHYYAIQVMWHAGGAVWNEWYPRMREILIASQQRNGSWADLISPEYGTAMACLILQMPSNYLPIFDR